jgi:hypothetical protein
MPYLDSEDRVFKLGPVQAGYHRLNENNRAFMFRVGRLRPGRSNGIHGVWEPLGARADWNMEFGHVLMLSGRVLDPRRSRREFFEARAAELDELPRGVRGRSDCRRDHRHRATARRLHLGERRSQGLSSPFDGNRRLEFSGSQPSANAARGAYRPRSALRRSSN